MKIKSDFVIDKIKHQKLKQKDVAKYLGMQGAAFSLALKRGGLNKERIDLLSSLLQVDFNSIIYQGKPSHETISDPIINQNELQNQDLAQIVKRFQDCLKFNTDVIRDYTSQKNKAWEVVNKAMDIITKTSNRNNRYLRVVYRSPLPHISNAVEK